MGENEIYVIKNLLKQKISLTYFSTQKYTMAHVMLAFILQTWGKYLAYIICFDPVEYGGNNYTCCGNSEPRLRHKGSKVKDIMTHSLRQPGSRQFSNATDKTTCLKQQQVIDFQLAVSDSIRMCSHIWQLITCFSWMGVWGFGWGDRNRFTKTDFSSYWYSSQSKNHCL